MDLLFAPNYANTAVYRSQRSALPSLGGWRYDGVRLGGGNGTVCCAFCFIHFLSLHGLDLLFSAPLVCIHRVSLLCAFSPCLGGDLGNMTALAQQHHAV